MEWTAPLLDRKKSSAMAAVGSYLIVNEIVNSDTSGWHDSVTSFSMNSVFSSFFLSFSCLFLKWKFIRPQNVTKTIDFVFRPSLTVGHCGIVSLIQFPSTGISNAAGIQDSGWKTWGRVSCRHPHLVPSPLPAWTPFLLFPSSQTSSSSSFPFGSMAAKDPLVSAQMDTQLATGGGGGNSSGTQGNRAQWWWAQEVSIETKELRVDSFSRRLYHFF